MPYVDFFFNQIASQIASQGEFPSIVDSVSTTKYPDPVIKRLIKKNNKGFLSKYHLFAIKAEPGRSEGDTPACISTNYRNSSIGESRDNACVCVFPEADLQRCSLSSCR